MIYLDLTKGICETEQYKAFKFSGSEIHFKSKIDLSQGVQISTRLNTSDEILFLCIVVETIRKDDNLAYIEVGTGYFPYAQADRNFAVGECFSLKTICNIINGLKLNKFIIYDPHSDVVSALLDNCEVIDNSRFITELFKSMTYDNNFGKDITILSPDAGAYKKIFKLAKQIGFEGQIECCNKYRNIANGEIDLRLPDNIDLNKDILIIDDICVGGATFIEIAKKLQSITNFKGKKYLAISHGIFSNGFEELGKYFDKIFVTNSRQDFELSKSEAHHKYKDLLSIYKII